MIGMQTDLSELEYFLKKLYVSFEIYMVYSFKTRAPIVFLIVITD